MFLYFYLLYTWNLKYVDIVTARTTVRLWHELHVAQKKDHDFQSLLSPNKDGFFIAAVRHDEIRSIAFCKRENLTSVYVNVIAHPPDHLNSPVELLILLRNNKIELSKEVRIIQPRWYYENMFHKTNVYDILGKPDSVLEGEEFSI